MSNVNHPAHYGGENNLYETIKVAEAWEFDHDAYLFNVLKYISRPKKGDYLEDLKKAKFYLERKIARMEEIAGTASDLEYVPLSVLAGEAPAVKVDMSVLAQTVFAVLIPFRGSHTTSFPSGLLVKDVAKLVSQEWNNLHPKDQVALPLGFNWTLGARVKGTYGPLNMLPGDSNAVTELKPFLNNRYQISLERVKR